MSTGCYLRVCSTREEYSPHHDAIARIPTVYVPDMGFVLSPKNMPYTLANGTVLQSLSPLFNPIIRDHVPPEDYRKERQTPPDRASFADPEKKSLLSLATKVDHLTRSIGTVLYGVNLKKLTPQQQDELALLVSERGVVFFQDQELSEEDQVKFFQHYGELDTHPVQHDVKYLTISGNTSRHRALLKEEPWPSNSFHADTSFELNPPSYSLLYMRETPEVDGDTLWTSQYGTYDELSPALKEIASSLHAVHSSRYQYETHISRNQKPRRPPIDTAHPLVRTHPVTKLRALNWNPGFGIAIDELYKAESDPLATFFTNHINEAADHQVRWRWTPNSAAFWDNRVTVHRVIPGKYKQPRRGTRTTVFGERPYFDPESKGREESEK